VAAEDQPALEAQQEVLADGLHALQRPPVQARRDAGRRRARMRRLDLDALADERLQALRGAVERVALGHRFRVQPSASMARARNRAALAGAAAATVWGLQERLDRRVFRCDYSDVELLGRGNRALGYVVHAANGAVFGLAFHELRRHRRVDAVTLALAEHVALWPLMALVEPQLARSPRAFAQSAWRHALFGALLGRWA
jgi:hypothetical protein